MTARARHSPADAHSPTSFDANGDLWLLEPEPDDRLGPPPGRVRRRSLTRRLIILMVLAGSGWVLLAGDDHAGPVGDEGSGAVDRTRRMARQAATEVWSQLQTQLSLAFAAKPGAPAGSAANGSGASGSVGGLPVEPGAVSQSTARTAGADDQSPAQLDVDVRPQRPVAAIASVAADGRESPAPTTEPRAGQSSPAATATAGRPVKPPDPRSARAQAVGLHPDMPRALLLRLSAVDFRNAGIAITKALAETPDDDVLFWPGQRKVGIAQFQVHFVPGAAAACRRYVVTVAKDGWLTTALPVEKCGIRAPPSRAGR